MKKYLKIIGLRFLLMEKNILFDMSQARQLVYLEDIKVTKEDAEKAQLSAESAYVIVLKYQNMKLFGEKQDSRYV